MTATARPADYREQHGCHDCAHVFVRGDYDEATEYFCAHGAPERPPCMSVSMKECPGLRAKSSVYGRAVRLWDAWSKDRDVRREGTCGSWEEGADGN